MLNQSNKLLIKLSVVITVAMMALALALPALAGGNVGACDEASLDAALAGGGTVTFSCNGIIPITTAKTITASTTIDGSIYTVVLSGTTTAKMFTVNQDIDLTFKNLTIQHADYGAVANQASIEMVNGGALTFDGITVKDSVYPDFGTFRADKGAGSSLTVVITGTTFSNNRATNYGAGAGTISNGILNIDNSVFTGNTGTQHYGGALLVNGASTATINNSQFISNTTIHQNGGAIRWDSSGLLTISNSEFRDNSSTGNGGSVYNGSISGDVTVSNTSFISNTSNYGGAIYSLGPVTVTAASAFTGNDVAAHGGAIYVKDSGAPLNVSDSLFESNKSDSNVAGPGAGGAIYAEGSGSLVTISASDFLSNTNRIDDNFGGAVAVYNGVTLSLSDSTFKWNSGNSGGAVGVWDSSATISNTNFYTNTVADGGVSGWKGRGGALYKKGSGTTTVNGSHFAGNTAENEGGAFYNENTSAVEQSVFTGNSVTGAATVDYGGAIYNRSGALQVSNSAFDGNSSVSGGGAILSWSGTTVKVERSTFMHNSTTNGGTLETIATSTQITNSTFYSNTALRGAGISAGLGALTLVNNTFSDNNNTGSSEATMYRSSGTANLVNNIIANTLNGLDCKGTISTNTNNLVEDGTCSDASNITADPQLGPLQDNGGDTWTMALQVGSPAVNAGANTGCPATDQRGVGRPIGSTCDMGAYEATVSTTGPGGVTAGLNLWLKANAGAGASDGDAVSAWTDQGAHGRDATQGVTANQPSYESDAAKQINFNPVVYFENTAPDKLLITGTAYASRDVMFVMRGNTTGFQTIYDNQQPGSGINDPDENDGISVTGNALDTSAMAWNYNTGSNGTAAGVYYVNGQQTPAATADTPLLVTVDKPQAETFTYMLNSNDGGFSYWQGDIAEFVVYAHDVSAAGRNKVESYLAIKYGITLTDTQGVSYTLSDGTTAWNANTNAAYHNDVAGIGRDDASVLHQPRSQSINTGSILQVYHDAFGGVVQSDLSSYIWGHNGGDTNFGVVVGDKIHMNRVWKVQDTKSFGGLTHIISDTTGAEVMWVDSDADCDFSTGAPSETTLTSGGGTLTATVNVADGRCFTFAKAAATTITVTKGTDTDGACEAADCSLREAIKTAGPGSTIVFSASMTATLSGGELPISGTKLHIDGSGKKVVIDGNGGQRVFSVTNSSTLTLTNLTVTGGNAGSGNGGGIGAVDSTVKLEKVTVNGNTTTGNGGGIAYQAGNTNGLTVINSTIAGNSAADGGGIWVSGSGTAAQAVLFNDTIAANTATAGAGGFKSTNTNHNVQNTIMADNTGATTNDCDAGHLTGFNATNNIIETRAGTCAGLTTNPGLGPLADNGGDTKTMAIGSGSSAYDTGDVLGITAEDQRGVPRPQGNGWDIGAYEFNTVLSISKTATDVNGTPLVAGDIIEYVVTVTSTKGSDQPGIVITDTIPANTTYVTGSASVSQGSVSGPDPLVADIGTLTSGSSATLTFRVTVDSGSEGQTIQNTAQAGSPDQQPEVEAGPSEPDGGGLVEPSADVFVSQSSQATASGYIITIVAGNAGPGDASGTVISDTFPSIFTSINWTCEAAGGAVCPSVSGTSNLFETLATFPSGGQVTYTVNSILPGNETALNTVEINPPAGLFDPDLGNNSATKQLGYRYLFPIIFKNGSI